MVGKIELQVNGKIILLNEFAGEIISSTIIGMIKSLKGVEKEIKDVKIRIEV